MHGPLTQLAAGQDEAYRWLDDPWPWEFKKGGLTMFVYEKKLQYPVRIKNCNPKLASIIISQYGGAYCNKLRYFFFDRATH